MEEPDRIPPEETREPPAGGQKDDVSPDPPRPGKDDEQTDREADETFPASDPPANY